jgi:hypothetical protein
MTTHPHAFRRLAAMLVLVVGLATFTVPAATAGTPDVPVAPPASTVKSITTPYFVGTPKVGYTLSARPGRWEPAAAAVTYAWFDGTRALGSGPTHVVRPAELGHTITITATASATARASATRSWTSPGAVLRGTFWIASKPKILGRATVGRRLKARSSATEPNGRRTYRWLRDGTAIRGASSSTYRVTKADRRHRLTVRVSYTAAAYETATRTSRATHRVR